MPEPSSQLQDVSDTSFSASHSVSSAEAHSKVAHSGARTETGTTFGVSTEIMQLRIKVALEHISFLSHLCLFNSCINITVKKHVKKITIYLPFEDVDIQLDRNITVVHSVFLSFEMLFFWEVCT